MLKTEFEKFLNKASQNPDHDDIFDQLKSAVVDEALRHHSWEDKASDVLRVLSVVVTI